MTALATGDTDSTIPYSGRTDEIGAMAGAVEIFRQTALAKIDADRRMEAGRAERERERFRPRRPIMNVLQPWPRRPTDWPTG